MLELDQIRAEVDPQDRCFTLLRLPLASFDAKLGKAIDVSLAEGRDLVSDDVLELLASQYSRWLSMCFAALGLEVSAEIDVDILV